ncbi:hypothetical protein QBC46DRAFT_343135 [Diplogelasinospora grovesii]|uniref:Uncharacterized protein n=1 Tax=Diplogelasinospora grovesii TaxID=303347 RepID=A0AAN6N469_9PEZI|nr:hypothetical protein QBC46DRAFT_343135 [Diplogelasinospora grovesii]
MAFLVVEPLHFSRHRFPSIMALLIAAVSSAELLPSYEALRSAGGYALLSPDAKRLRWSVNGPLTSAILVMKDPWVDPDDATPEPYCQQQTTPDGATVSWHPVSQSPLTEPKISSVTVHVDPLEDWEWEWLQQHAEETEPGGDYDPTMVRYGPLPDAESESEEGAEGPVHLF